MTKQEWNPPVEMTTTTQRAAGNSRMKVVDGRIVVERRAHKCMTPEEYTEMKLIGWHMVCKDYDGFGGVGVIFLGINGEYGQKEKP